MNRNSSASFTDIHCHILPGIDDGPGSVEQSIAMAERCVAGGIRQLIATPHYIKGTAWAISGESIRKRVAELQEVLQQNNIRLTLYPGMEIALHQHLLQQLQRNQLLPLANSNCFLLEPPFHPFRGEMLTVLRDVVSTGAEVILAHPERIPFFQQDPSSLVQLGKQGIMIQVNLGSLFGQFGKKSKATADYLVQNDCIHFVASDAHDSDRRSPPAMNDWKQLEQIFGSEQAKKVCLENPARLLGHG